VKQETNQEETNMAKNKNANTVAATPSEDTGKKGKKGKKIVEDDDDAVVAKVDPYHYEKDEPEQQKFLKISLRQINKAPRVKTKWLSIMEKVNKKIDTLKEQGETIDPRLEDLPVKMREFIGEENSIKPGLFSDCTNPFVYKC
jgi:hypothetical protein